MKLLRMECMNLFNKVNKKVTSRANRKSCAMFCEELVGTTEAARLRNAPSKFPKSFRVSPYLTLVRVPFRFLGINNFRIVGMRINVMFS